MSEACEYDSRVVIPENKRYFRGSDEEFKEFDKTNSWHQGNYYRNIKAYEKWKDIITAGSFHYFMRSINEDDRRIERAIMCEIVHTDLSGVSYKYRTYSKPVMIDEIRKGADPTKRTFRDLSGGCVWWALEDIYIDPETKETQKSLKEKKALKEFRKLRLDYDKPVMLKLNYHLGYYNIVNIDPKFGLKICHVDNEYITNISFSYFLDCYVIADEKYCSKEYSICGTCNTFYVNLTTNTNYERPVCDKCKVCASCGYNRGLRRTFVPDLPDIYLCVDCRKSYYNTQEIYTRK